MSTETLASSGRSTESVEHVVIRFAGDSGDGMQLTGSQFSLTSALAGNDIVTLPDFPAEIRAPAGTLPGVSGYQVNFSSQEIFTPGDQPDVLVAMNPAALKVNLDEIKKGGLIIVNVDNFGPRDLAKAHYESNPLEDGSLDGFRVLRVELTRLTRAALTDSGLTQRQIDRCKNLFALGMMYWLYERPAEPTKRWIEKKFASRPELVEANLTVLKAGASYAEATELFEHSYRVQAAEVAPGTYRNISGNAALSLGLVAASVQSERPLFLGSYPITPASDILHELSRFKTFGALSFQAEDEIAAMGSAIGAAYGGALSVTSTSGPGMALKGEALGLAAMTELPLVVVNIQRAGPSTGMPTKTEQSDLFQALYGRNSDITIPVLAPRSPSDCFAIAIEAARIAFKYMVPVVILSDGYLANGIEPWKLPDVASLPRFPVQFHTDPATYKPYLRDAETLARPFAVPGTPGLEHRIGGLEKDDVNGNVSYDPGNHERMTQLRAEKVKRVENDIPETEILGDPSGGRLLVVGWGSTYGAITAAVRKARAAGKDVSAIHLRHLNPLPPDLGDILRRYERVLVPEMNMGQLWTVLRARFLLDVKRLSKVQGRPFNEGELLEAFARQLETEHV